jgi:hypothetical protein
VKQKNLLILLLLRRLVLSSLTIKMVNDPRIVERGAEREPEKEPKKTARFLKDGGTVFVYDKECIFEATLLSPQLSKMSRGAGMEMRPDLECEMHLSDRELDDCWLSLPCSENLRVARGEVTFKHEGGGVVIG